MNSFQLHELETAVALVLLSPRLRVSQTAGRSGHRTRQESRERRDDNNTGDHCLRRRPLRLRSRQRFVRIGRQADAGQSFAGFVIQCYKLTSNTDDGTRPPEQRSRVSATKAQHHTRKSGEWSRLAAD